MATPTTATTDLNAFAWTYAQQSGDLEQDGRPVATRIARSRPRPRRISDPWRLQGESGNGVSRLHHPASRHPRTGLAERR